MTEYIKRDDIVLKYEFGMVSDNGVVCIPMRDVNKSIANTPAVDAVEVVRCKDCVFGKCIEDSGNYKCTTFNGRFGTVKPEDFCSYGERKRQNES